MLKINRSGFTIIELLIVIVIIGILSAVITTGIGRQQEKARTTSKLLAAKSFEVGLNAYLAEYNKFPLMEQSVCLGEYPSMSFVCKESTVAAWGGMTPSATFNAELAKVMSDPTPEVDLTPITFINGGLTETMKGIAFQYNEQGYVLEDNTKKHYSLAYFIEGENQDCGIGVNGWNPATGKYTMDNSASYTFSFNGNTACGLLFNDGITTPAAP